MKNYLYVKHVSKLLLSSARDLFGNRLLMTYLTGARRLGLLGSLISIAAFSLFAQEQTGAKETAVQSADDVPDSSIDIAPIFQADANKTARIYRERALKDMRRLYVLVKNYGEQVSGARQAFEEIKVRYRNAMERYYQRQYTWALDFHHKNRESIRQLFTQFAAKYKEQADRLLANGLQMLLDAEVAGLNRRGSKIKPNEYLDHLRNSIKLKLAYNQMAMGREMDHNRLPRHAIEHYRLAKVFAIGAMRSMETDPQRRKELKVKYSRDLLDSRGLVVSDFK